MFSTISQRTQILNISPYFLFMSRISSSKGLKHLVEPNFKNIAGINKNQPLPSTTKSPYRASSWSPSPPLSPPQSWAWSWPSWWGDSLAASSSPLSHRASSLLWCAPGNCCADMCHSAHGHRKPWGSYGQQWRYWKALKNCCFWYNCTKLLN